jgi:hypothetical protein
LYENIIFYIDCRRTNGIAMLKSTDHDSMSGEHVGTTSEMIVTSGKSVICPLAAPENQGSRKMQKFLRGGKKDLGKRIFCEIAYGRRQDAAKCVGKRDYGVLLLL